MIADTLYGMLAEKLRRFERCDVPKIFRFIFHSFVEGPANIRLEGNRIVIEISRKAHNPILRDVPWQRLPPSLSWLNRAKLELRFR